ncbi:hypothetical protein [Streptomyces sp. VRA16 Mangrove soil]|uniref:hypothetical protein n=1 Tax=Streptomyces sp. VRA16 Mangrove soil TaxID=2817434 RepID=UPI001A9ED3BD|nr:hypothetical protein [Streptomyces sp. VRA16 Mangrove soil]MBO1335817.1 hypothetical protein [Streptomyces sp. VRA16 Mangrove soil]
MARWVITVEHARGDVYDVVPVARFDGTREQAHRRLYETACTHRFSSTLREQGRDVFRRDDGTYYVEIQGALTEYRLRYCLAELVWSAGERAGGAGRSGTAARHTSAGRPDPDGTVPDYWRPPGE